MPGLRETLEAATPQPWELHEFDNAIVHDGVLISGPARTADARLIALAPELAALVLDMGDYLRDLGLTRYGDEPGDALLARLDQLGKEQT